MYMTTPSPKDSTKNLLSVTRARNSCSLREVVDRAYPATGPPLNSSRCTISSFRLSNNNSSSICNKCTSKAFVASKLLAVRTF